MMPKQNGKIKAVFITGGAGRFGRALSLQLMQMNIPVRSLVATKEDIARLPPGVIPFVGDIEDKRVLTEACQGVDTIFHLAAVTSQFKKSYKEIIRVNTVGTLKLLEAAEAAGVKHIIFTSTLDVYGRRRNGKLTEESELKPTDMYGHSKMLAEDIIKDFKGKIKYTIFRMGVIYGPEYENSFFKIFRVIKEGKAHIIGNGKNHLALINLNDAIRAMILAMQKPTSFNKIYNLTDGKFHTQEELWNGAADLLNAPRPTSHISQLLVGMVARARGLDSDEIRFITSNREADISKVKKELGFRPEVDIKTGSRYLINRFLRKNN